MNYEVQQELSRKAGKQEVYSLREEINNLKNEKRSLRDKVERCESRLENQSSGIAQIIDTLLEKESYFNNANQLIQIKNYL